MKLVVKPLVPVSDEEVKRNEANAYRLGFPRMGTAGTARLAVVGGGNSILDREDEIRAFNGDIWAINRTFRWCKERGIDAWFYSCDPLEIVAECAAGAKRAIVATLCHPSVFEALSDAQVEAFDVMREGSPNGPTSAATAALQAILKGYREVAFYGCESSFDQRSHAYGHFVTDNLVKIACNGLEFLTTPDLYCQAEHMAEDIRKYPGVLLERSGGLLRAMVADPNPDMVACSRTIYNEITRAA